MNTFSLRRCRYAAATLLVSTLVAAAAQSPPVAPTASRNAGAATDIRDIRGPKPIASPWLVPLVVITVILAFGGAYGAWAWNRRRSSHRSSGLLDIALLRLEKARELMAPARGREFSIEVSSAVRDYIESRFEVRAAHLTTDEFLKQFLEPADALLTAHRTLLDNFLQTCDLAKFGGWNLDAAEMELMLQSARRFVVESAAEAGGARPHLPMDRPPNSASTETYVSLPST